MIDLEKQPMCNPAGWSEIDRLRAVEGVARKMREALVECAEVLRLRPGWEASRQLARAEEALAAASAAGIGDGE